MTVYVNQVSGTGLNDGAVLGAIFFENISGPFQRGIRTLIRNDILAFNQPAGAFAIALWNVSLINKGSLENIPGFDGNPNRFKLGSISFNTVGQPNDFFYWNYVNQGFPSYECLVSPQNYGGTPVTPSDLPALITTRQIQFTNSLSTGVLGATGAANANHNHPSLFGNTGFGVRPTYDSQVYDVAINYYASWGVLPANVPANYLVNI